MSEYERLCYAQTARTEKQAIYFVLRPKYFASGLNPAIFRKQRATENSTPCTELKKVSGESCLRRDCHRQSHTVPILFCS